MTEALVRFSDVVVRFDGSRPLRDVLLRRRPSQIHAVDGVSFELYSGEVLALVGESGSGKTTIAMSLVGHLRPAAGTVLVNGRNPALATGPELLRLRRSIQVILQDPYASLNPRMTVGQIVREPLMVHGVRDRSKADRLVESALGLAGLHPVDLYIDRRPGSLSGGQRQRVAIAAALVLEPRVLVADEPVSMLDVSIRAEILNLLARLARDQGLAVLMITHDLATVAAYSDRIGVMYLGRLVEIGPTEVVLGDPAHPYTRALVSVVPRLQRSGDRTVLSGEIPDPSAVPPGCRFHPRCPVAIAACRTHDPSLVRASSGQLAACLLVGTMAPPRQDTGSFSDNPLSGSRST